MKKFLSRLLLIILFFAGAISEGQAASEGIATLKSFKGEVHIKSLGAWGVIPEKGLPVYAGDKIITRKEGAVRILFHDGSLLEIQHNSNVRIVEASDINTKTVWRKIRLLLGKLRYKSGSTAKNSVSLISPTAVAGIRGTDLWFGTDGSQTFLDQIEGESDKKGNITEGAVPDITSEQAEEDLNYQASLNAIQAWQSYETDKVNLENAKFDADENAFMKFSRTDKVIRLLLSSEDGMDKYSNLMGRLAEYAETSAFEDMTENLSFMNNPDTRIAEDAVQGRKETGLAVDRAQDIIKSAGNYRKKILDLKKQYDNTENKEKRDSILTLIEATLESNSTYEKSVLPQMLFGEGITIGLPGFREDTEELLALCEDIFLSNRDIYEKTENYVNTVLRTLDGKDKREDTDAIKNFYSKMAEISDKMILTNAGVVNLLVNNFEFSLLNTKGKEKEGVRNALWDAIDARNEFTVILANAEVKNITEHQQLDSELEKIGNILEKTESSSSISGWLANKFQRTSVVLSLPVRCRPREPCQRCVRGKIVPLNHSMGPCQRCVNGEIEKLTGTPCDDEDDCTANDICQNGKCRGIPEASCAKP